MTSSPNLPDDIAALGRFLSSTAEGDGRLAATAYLAPEGFLAPLVEELDAADAILLGDRLLVAPGPERPSAWAANVWRDPRLIPIASIKDAARRLKALGRNWALLGHSHHRRATLIQEQLPHVSARPLRFPEAPPTAPLGSWMMVAPGHVLAAADCASRFRHGEARFEEDREGPPSRAYLKLWEAFTRLDRRPAPGDRCLDLGAAPGGWTWVLNTLGATVISVDKAPLDPKLAQAEGVDHRRESAFGLDPRTIGPVDWLVSDVICYPSRLFDLVERWRASGLVQNFVVTIKFQGATDHVAARAFAAVPGSQLFHLHVNKHELTWALVQEEG